MSKHNPLVVLTNAGLNATGIGLLIPTNYFLYQYYDQGLAGLTAGQTALSCGFLATNVKNEVITSRLGERNSLILGHALSGIGLVLFCSPYTILLGQFLYGLGIGLVKGPDHTVIFRSISGAITPFINTEGLVDRLGRLVGGLASGFLFQFHPFLPSTIAGFLYLWSALASTSICELSYIRKSSKTTASLRRTFQQMSHQTRMILAASSILVAIFYVLEQLPAVYLKEFTSFPPYWSGLLYFSNISVGVICCKLLPKIKFGLRVQIAMLTGIVLAALTVSVLFQSWKTSIVFAIFGSSSALIVMLKGYYVDSIGRHVTTTHTTVRESSSRVVTIVMQQLLDVLFTGINAIPVIAIGVFVAMGASFKMMPKRLNSAQ